MGIGEDLVSEIVRRIRGVTCPARIILFGSAADGTMSRDSDVDLLVVAQSCRSPRADSITIRRSLLGLGYPFDVVVMSEERFEETKDLVGGIAYPARKYGRVIYEAA